MNDDAEELKVEESPEKELERETPVLNAQDVEELQRTEMERVEARMKQEEEDKLMAMALA